MKNVRSYFGFRQKKSRLLKLKDLCSLVQKILETCERVANIFLHPGANYIHICIIYIPCVNQRM